MNLDNGSAALAGGIILVGRDGCYRDMASMHGHYRKVEETIPAIELLGKQLSAWNVADCHWLLDQPVSNSGRLRALLLQTAADRGWKWSVDLVPNPDRVLCETAAIIASSDSQILDAASQWFNLARAVIALACPNARILPLGS